MMGHAPDATARPNVSARNDGLDLVRALGAFLVFATHLYHAFGQTWLGPLASGGNMGIYLFFPLSGYLLYRPFLSGTVDLGRYAVARVARLAPAYYLVALVLILVDSPNVRDRWWVLATASYNVFEGPGFPQFGQSWTIGVEVAFYVLLPLLALTRRSLTLWLIVVGSYLASTLGGPRWWVLELPVYLWSFGLGMLVARYQDRLPAITRWAWLPGAGLVIVGLLAAAADSPASRLVGAGGAVLIAWAVVVRPSIPWARWPADLSYSVYLWHFFVAGTIFGLGLTGPLLVPVAIAATCAIATASWILLERPVIERASAWVRRRHDERPAAVGAVAGPSTP
jgi:peptidoglycan/LPS O-acetylase OafA/YrhL